MHDDEICLRTHKLDFFVFIESHILEVAAQLVDPNNSMLLEQLLKRESDQLIIQPVRGTQKFQVTLVDITAVESE